MPQNYGDGGIAQGGDLEVPEEETLRDLQSEFGHD